MTGFPDRSAIIYFLLICGTTLTVLHTRGIVSEWEQNSALVSLLQRKPDMLFRDCLVSLPGPTNCPFALDVHDQVVLFPPADFETTEPLLSGRDYEPLVRGVLLLANGRRQDTIALWQGNQQIARHLYAWGRKANQVDEAVTLYRLSIAVAPSSQSYYRLGEALANTGAEERAVYALEQALSLDHRSLHEFEQASLYALLGDLYAKQAKSTQALEAYEQALKLRPNLTSGTLGIARLDLAAGRTEAAVSRLEQALSRRSDVPALYFWLARAYLAQSRLEKAEEMFEQTVLLQPSFASAWRLLGDVRTMQTDSLGALEAYRRFLEIVPEDREVTAQVQELERNLETQE